MPNAATKCVAGDVNAFMSNVATSFNQLLRLSVGSFKHYAQDHFLTYSTLSGSDTAATNAAIHAANELMVRYLAHLADAVAHIAADTPPALVPATSLATAITLANAIKADYATHIADAGVHPNADATNTVAASDATNLATLQTLLNEMLNTTAYQAHVQSGPAVSALKIVNG